MARTRQRKPKTIIYKRAEFTHPGLVLETLLSGAMSKFPKPANRRQITGDPDQDSGVRKVIGSCTDASPMMCGTFLLYEIGKDVAFVVEDESAEEFVIEAQHPDVGLSKLDNKRREVLESALYFGVWGNHVVLVQSAALKSRDFESHLQWFLENLAKVIGTGTTVCLSDEPSLKAREQIENLPVKAVEVGTPVISEAVDPSSVRADATSLASHRLGGKALQILSAFVGDGVLNQLNLDSALDDANLELTLQLKYKRKTTDSGHRAIDHIARAMRHAEPEDTKVITGSGTVIKGKDLKLTGTIIVDTYNGVVDAEDIYAQMHRWLEDRIAEGSVT